MSHNLSLAMVLCIRNEAEFLEAHLAYHRALGVSRAYIFLDRCTDGSADIARAHDWVVAIPRDRDPDDRFMSAHQVKCLNDGLDMARDEGIDWLMHIDPDEFACGDSRPLWLRPLVPTQRLLSAANLPAMLAHVNDTTEQIILRPKDVVPTPQPSGTPFWRLHYFQHRGAIQRNILDPTTGKVERFTQRLGHYKGKAIVRTSANVQAASAHRWARGGESIPDTITDSLVPTEERGFHYHYIVTSAARWLAKHRKFAEYPATWQKGTPVRFPRQTWKEASLTMTDDEAKAYFDRWIAVSSSRMRWPMIRGEIVHDTFVEDVLQACGFLQAHQAHGETNRYEQVSTWEK